MNELELVKLWNQKRSQIVSAQMAPTVMLGVIVIALAFGKLTDASGTSAAIGYLAIGVVAATGLLATISQFAAIREAEALVKDLADVSDLSATGTAIKDSASFLSMTKLVIVALDVVVFALVVAAVRGLW